VIMTISGADVFTPRAAADTLRKMTDVNAQLLASIEQARANQVAQGVTGEPIAMLDAMFDAAQIKVATLQQAADRADQHCNVVADTVGSDPSLADTQSGKYMDPSAL
jgi:hypothetical protein